jgi:hypothetical protein
MQFKRFVAKQFGQFTNLEYPASNTKEFNDSKGTFYGKVWYFPFNQILHNVVA